MKPLKIHQHIFDWGARTYVMGILNVTPDSFSGDGIIAQGDAVKGAVEQAGSFLTSGADILDVGGESTRPGSEPVNAEAEMARVIPVVEALKVEFPDALISIDTYKAAVAEAASKRARTLSTMSGGCAPTPHWLAQLPNTMPRSS